MESLSIRTNHFLNIKTLWLSMLLSMTTTFAYATLSIAQNNTSKCPGISYSYTVTNSVTTTCIYEWTVTNGVISGGTQNGSTSTFSGGENVTITWFDVKSGGTISVTARTCSDASGNTTASFSAALLSLNGLDPGSVTGSPGADAVQINTTPNFVYTVPQIQYPTRGSLDPNPYNITTYEWQIPSGWSVISGGTSNTITVKADNCTGGNIRVRGKSSCTNGNFNSNWSAPFSVIRTLATPVAITGPSGVDCTDTTIKNYSISPVQGASGYVWTLPAGWTGSSTSTSIAVTPSGNNGGTLSVKATGCSIQSEARTLSITLNPLNPIISGDGPVCFSLAKTFVVNNVPSTGSVTTWTVTPSNLVNTASGSGTSASFKAISAYDFGAATVTFNVVNAACNLSKSVPKTIWVGFPSAPGPITGNTSPSVGGIYLYSAASAPQGAAYYNWTLPYGGNPAWSQSGGNINGIINTLTPNLIAGSSSGWVQAYGVNLCGSGPVSKIRVFPTGGGGGGGQQQRIAVFPNPTSTSLNIETTTSELSISETNDDKNAETRKKEDRFSAKLLNQFNVELRKGESKNGKLTFDIENLQDGLYYLHVQNGNELITKQIIIKK
jgi:hypothetical protein